jgi:hypothetical protein
MGLIFTSISVILCCVFIGGSITRIYGYYCGIDIYNPSSWWTSFILHGSPYCKFLNNLSFYSHFILENIYIYIAMAIMAKFSNVLPFLNIGRHNHIPTPPTHDPNN